MRRRLTLAEAVAAGGDAGLALSQFLDDFRRSGDGRASMIAEEPPLTGDAELDARVAATAEALANEAGIEAPGWVREESRHLRGGPHWAYLPDRADARAYLLETTPTEFASRGLFTGPDVLSRA